MNRKWVAALAVGLLASTGVARADYGGPLPPQSPPPAAEAAEPYGPHAYSKFGVNPGLRWLAFWKKGWGGCESCKQKSGGGGFPVGSIYDIPKREFAPGGQFGPGGPGLGGPPGAGLPGTPPNQMPGTLVFPNHPYVRSPRDFFMYDQGGR